jgi:hypothetical protein
MRKWSTHVDLTAAVSVNNSAEVAVFEDIPMHDVEELILEVADAGASNCTLKLYGSLDGTVYSQLYFYGAVANIHEGTAAAPTQLTSAGNTLQYWTDKVMPFMKLTAQRASAGAALVTVRTKMKR